MAWRVLASRGAVAAVGPFQIAAQLYTFPRYIRAHGYRKTFVRTMLVSAAFAALTPWLSTLFAVLSRARAAGVTAVVGASNATATPIGGGWNATTTARGIAQSPTGGRVAGELPRAPSSLTRGERVGVWVAMWLAQLGMMLPVIMAFTCVFVFINNSVHRSLRGRLNGIAQALVAVARVLGPLVCSNLFAWGASRPWPAYMVGFYILSLVGCATAALALQLPSSIEKQIKEAPVEPAVPAAAKPTEGVTVDPPPVVKSMATAAREAAAAEPHGTPEDSDPARWHTAAGELPMGAAHCLGAARHGEETMQCEQGGGAGRTSQRQSGDRQCA